MNQKPYIIGAVLALAGLVAWQWARAGRSMAPSLDSESNGASMPRLPALAPLPPLRVVSGAVPNMPAMPAMPGMPPMPRMPAMWRP